MDFPIKSKYDNSLINIPFNLDESHKDIVIYEGPCKFFADDKQLDGHVKMFWVWSSRPHVKCNLKTKTKDVVTTISHGNHYSFEIDAGQIFDIVLDFHHHNFDEKGYVDLLGEVVDSNKNNREIQLNKVTFCLPNFPYFFCPRIRDSDGIKEIPIEFKYGDWVVKIQSLDGTTAQNNSFQSYIYDSKITHVGEIKKNNGSSFTHGEVTETLNDIGFAMSFLVKRWTSPILRLMYDDKNNIAYRCFERIRLEPHSFNGDPIFKINSTSLVNFIQKFCRVSTNSSLFMDLKNAIGSFVEAYRIQSIESTIILSFTGIELVH